MKQKINLILLRTCLLMSIAIMLFSLTACIKNAESSSDDDSSLIESSEESSEESSKEITGELYLRTVYSGGSLQISWIYLGSDGTIVRNPMFGVNPVQKDKELANNGKGTGVYTKTATGFDIKWSDGSTQSLNAQYKNGKLSGFDGGVCTSAIPFSTKSFANETYTGSGSFGGANYSESVTLTLNSDNTFSWKSKIYMQETSSYHENIKTGKYELNGNTLKFVGAEDFIYNNQYCTVQPYDMGNKVDLILGGSHFKRKL